MFTKYMFRALLLNHKELAIFQMHMAKELNNYILLRGY